MLDLQILKGGFEVKHVSIRVLCTVGPCECCLQTKRKGFNAAEARVADTGADQFFDPKTGVPKAEAGVRSTPGKKAGRYHKSLFFSRSLQIW